MAKQRHAVGEVDSRGRVFRGFALRKGGMTWWHGRGNWWDAERKGRTLKARPWDVASDERNIAIWSKPAKLRKGSE